MPPQGREKLIEDIQYLRQLDALLRGGGVHLPSLASEWQVTTRTINRYLVVLREIVGPTEVYEYPGDDPKSRTGRQ